MPEIVALDDLETVCWRLLIDHDHDMSVIDPFDFGLGFGLGRGLSTDAALKLGREMRVLWDTSIALGARSGEVEV